MFKVYTTLKMLGKNTGSCWMRENFMSLKEIVFGDVGSKRSAVAILTYQVGKM